MAENCCLDCRLERGGCGKPALLQCSSAPIKSKITMACPSSPKAAEEVDYKNWPKDDSRRILHAVYRVGDIEKSMKWYQECLGMHILRKRDVPEDKYMNLFMGYGSEDNHFAAELTYNYGVAKYDLGDSFSHFGIAVPNVQARLDMIKKLGYKTPASPTKEGNAVFAFVEDPDGYKFKLIQRKTTREPFCQVSYRVGDVDRAILFYQDIAQAYGMKLIARRDFPALKKTMAYVAYDLDETRTTVIEFEYNYGKTDYAKGTAYAQLAIGTEDVFKTAGACELNGGKTVRAAGALPMIGTKIYSVIDPDGWKTVWVDNSDFAKELEPFSFVHEVHCTTNNAKEHRPSTQACSTAQRSSKTPSVLLTWDLDEQAVNTHQL